MATNFPTSLDTFTNPQPTDNLATVSHSSQHDNINDSVAALEAKVGVNLSAVTTSLDYKVAHPFSGLFLPGNVLTTMDRYFAGTSASGTSTNTIYTQFVSTATFTSTKATVYVTATDATANVTSAYLSLYTLDASGNGTQVAVTATTTSMFNAAGPIAVNWVSSVNITAGTIYAFGWTFSVSAGAPQLAGGTTTLAVNSGPLASPANAALWFVARGASSVPPATFTKASLTFASFSPIYAEIS